MNTLRFNESVNIDCSDDVVFNYTQDYKNRLKWDVFLKSASLMDNATEAGRGVKAYCVAKNGLGMITEYITYNPPKVTAIKMIRGPYLFKSFQGSWTFKQIDPSGTEVVFTYSFQLKFPFNLIGNFIKANLQKNVRKRLEHLKKNIEQQ
jgi:ribosome-associated toxin RatA of RatAB toxin-antitoxin module